MSVKTKIIFVVALAGIFAAVHFLGVRQAAGRDNIARADAYGETLRARAEAMRWEATALSLMYAPSRAEGERRWALRDNVDFDARGPCPEDTIIVEVAPGRYLFYPPDYKLPAAQRRYVVDVETMTRRYLEWRRQEEARERGRPASEGGGVIPESDNQNVRGAR